GEDPREGPEPHDSENRQHAAVALERPRADGDVLACNGRAVAHGRAAADADGVSVDVALVPDRHTSPRGGDGALHVAENRDVASDRDHVPLDHLAGRDDDVLTEAHEVVFIRARRIRRLGWLRRFWLIGYVHLVGLTLGGRVRGAGFLGYRLGSVLDDVDR